MAKVFTVLLLLLLSLSSFTSYLYLTEKISSGQKQIAEGQKKLAEGQELLEKGKARLEHGRQKLARAKKLYRGLTDIPFMGIVDKLPISGTAFKEASNEISAGDLQVAQGAVKIEVGEAQLAAGKLALRKGEESLSLANTIRVTCKFVTAFCVSLALLLGFFWRRTLVTVVRNRRVKA